jgi:hypothetical protein
MSSPRIACLVALVSLAVAPVRPVAAQRLGFQFGADTQWFSEIRYEGYWTAGATLFYPTLVKEIDNGGLGLEIRLAYEGGDNVPITPDQATPEELAEFAARGEEPNVDLHHILLAVTPLWRQRLLRPVDYEFGIGLSVLNQRIITTGTRWNFLFIVGLGVELPGERGWPSRAGLRLEHFSNGGDVGVTSARPIGLESLSLAVEWSL